MRCKFCGGYKPRSAYPQWSFCGKVGKKAVWYLD